MIEIIEKKKCCGCAACANKCPKHCIEMKADEEGFLYPVVDKEICTNCGICNKICPVLNKKADNKEPESYMMYSKNEHIREMSSSGGVFSHLADVVLKQHGIVFGAAFSEDYNKVLHLAVNNNEDLKKLRGSKYLQSEINTSYVDTKNALELGKVVLFSGTACQIEGLQAYLGKSYDNLYTVDVLCHGVPSPLVWKRYLKEKECEYGSRLIHMSFRDKEKGWKKFQILMKFENGSSYQSLFGSDLFMKFFLRNICLRPSCHDCKFKSVSRTSDLTIGDCWGIEKHSPEMHDDKGTSVVLIHSEKGKHLIESIANEVILKSGEVDILLPSESDSRKSVRPHRNRKLFFREFQKAESISQLEKLLEQPLYIKILKKMGLLRPLRKIKRYFLG